MKLSHKLGLRAEKKEGEGSFLLTDKTGSYLSLSANKQNQTQMQGFFKLDKNWEPYKYLENIFLDKDVEELENNFSHITRKSGKSKEKFYLTTTALIYEVNNYKGFINLEVDFRNIFDFNDENRFYKIKKEKDLLIIYYKKNSRYLVLKGVKDFEQQNFWEKRNYSYDELRNTKSEFYIYKVARIKCNKKIKLFITTAKKKNEAKEKAEIAAKNESSLKEILETRIKNVCKEKNLGISASLNSLDSLRTIIGKGDYKLEGLFAGLPWFYQLWSRDELISLKAFMIENRFDFVKKRLTSYLGLINGNGRLPNRIPESNLSSADSIGWLFKRYCDLIIILEEKKLLKKYFTKKELLKIKHKLHFSIEEQMARYMKNKLIFNRKNETWMDTTINHLDARAGACIEIQALFLSGFKLMKKLCRQLKLPYYGYRTLEKMLSKEVKKNFFKNGMLRDRIGDDTCRPNIFIAYYVYPELLKKYEWKIVFKKTLDKLWLEWGGLASIDKKHSLFKQKYTGHNNLSYHRGDSWFWINNLSAICMADLDYKEFHYYIDYIFKASKNDLLFSGFIGHGSELSSAKSFEPCGCWAQAWSSATFVELAKTLRL
ncbi:hypothetical protein CMO90_00655 [Candidatus Woesearchaeota archaeon]|jgi:glycogen debranching enzyme|nr:hypothetical protein [Candidatus Woesearchaeota archaeon]